MNKRNVYQKDLRTESRVEIAQKAWLVIGDKTVPCIVRDMSDSGLLIISAEGLEVGQKLEFVCELFPQKTLECKIEVVHISNVGAGARFVELDARRENIVRVYLQEVFALGGKLRR